MSTSSSGARQPGRLAGTTALIVGGTGGIGLATARRFVQEGARVVAAGRDAERGRHALLGLLPADRVLDHAWAIEVDTRSAASVDRMFEQTRTLLGGRLDILFHVAGLSGRKLGDGALHECTEAGWDEVVSVNARGLFLTNRGAVRWMLGQPMDDYGLRGTVLNMSSVLARSPAPRFFGTYAYAASKGAIESMSLASAARYGPDRIRFNVIAPALIDTPMSVRAASSGSILNYLKSKQPLAGGPGSADDCAEAALYLCEPASRFVTGVVLNVDGGWCVSEGQIPRPEDPGTHT